ncbi:MAG: hypothetical protein H6868_07665 [Rhodospirillales bacterium]|nr:hypothetical protein [Rhodospirillales bacterium]
MIKKIERISIVQTSLTLSTVTTLVLVPLMFIQFIIALMQGGNILGLFLVVLFPLVYLLGAFALFAFIFWIYNMVADWLGGIEFTVTDR